MELTYEAIKPIILSEEIDGQMIKLKFKANNQDAPLETMAYVAPDQDEIMKSVGKSVGKSVATNIAINSAASALGSAIGGIGGSIARSAGSVAANQASSSMMNTDDLTKTEVTDEKKQAAVVQAFSYLSMYYEHNGTEWEYVQPGS